MIVRKAASTSVRSGRATKVCCDWSADALSAVVAFLDVADGEPGGFMSFAITTTFLLLIGKIA